MQFCDHKRSSRHCGFYSPQVSSLDNTTMSPDMREVDREGRTVWGTGQLGEKER